MEFVTEIISKETIKPSSPTPEFLRNHQLSFLDQVYSPSFIPLIFFYPFNPNQITTLEKINELKSSLSQVLTSFYPLAGRLVNDKYPYVHCNDQGAPFVIAKTNCDLKQVTEYPVIAKHMNYLLPYKLDDVKDLGLVVQVTCFKCGGISIGVAISHKFGDASSLVVFANAWASKKTINPKFEGASIFPPCDITGFNPPTQEIGKEELVTKMFRFNESKISILKNMYSGKLIPSRVEAVSSFIWTRLISATNLKPDTSKSYVVLYSLNLRSRLEPPLSEEYFGNLSHTATALPALVGDKIEGGYELVEKVRKAVRAVNNESIAPIRDGKKYLSFIKEKIDEAEKNEVFVFHFTSFCRFPLYEMDFGWGKPVWVGFVELAYKNMATFVDTSCGNGIEAWVNLEKDDMMKFETDMELKSLLAYEDTKACL